MTTNNFANADIHTHILPNIDDGAKSVDESLELLIEEKNQGVTDVVLTPHFDISDISIDEFLLKRSTSFKALREKINETGVCEDINLYLGAEVRYDPNLIYTDIYNLCIENTAYLLLELSGSYPFNFEQTIHWLVSQGVTPILAHVERYDYLVSNKTLLEKLLLDGVVLQCNASSVFSKHYYRRVKKLIKKGCVHILASDTHDMIFRPPMLEQAYLKIKKHKDKMILNSQKIITDRII